MRIGINGFGRIGERWIGFSEHADPSDIPWADLGIDVVIEASGTSVMEAALTPHLDNGARAALESTA